MAANYTLGEDGRLLADLPARRVPVQDEGALYRRLARLAGASDAEIVAAAGQLGPIGPVLTLSIPDRPGFLLVTSRQRRAIVDRIPSLHKWIATGGSAPIHGRDALTAHTLCAFADGDPEMSDRLIAWLSGAFPVVKPEDASSLLAACDLLEEVSITALSRRIATLLDDMAHPDQITYVRPVPPADRHLRRAAKLFRLLATKADDMAPELISPNRLGGLATELAPYFPDGNVVPAESIEGWRTAARLLGPWARIARFRSALPPRLRRDVRDALVAQLQRIDAWPLPTGEVLGTYARALWSLWPILGDSRVPRSCAAPTCQQLLPLDAHGNREFCDDHIREHDRMRAARNRARRKAATLGDRVS